MARDSTLAPPRLLLLGDATQVTAALNELPEFCVKAATPSTVFQHGTPDLILVEAQACTDPDVLRLRNDIGLQDVPFVALRGFEAHPEHFDDWFDLAHISREALQARLSATLNGARQRAAGNRRMRLLYLLDDSLRSLTDPEQITYRAAAIVGVNLGVNRCAYADVEADQDTFNLAGNFNDGVESIVGRYRFTQFGNECHRLMCAGQPYVVSDTETDPRTEGVRDSYRLTEIRSVICVPIRKEGRFVAAMAVHMKVPRVWQEAEVRLLMTVADRCWESIERAKVERVLRAAEARYRTLVETVSAVLWTTDEDGKVRHEMPVWAEFTGQTFAEYCGDGWVNAVHPDDRQRMLETWKSTVSSHVPLNSHYRLRRADGVYRHMMSRAVLVVGANGVNEWNGNCVDVTEMHEAQHALEEASERLQFTLDSAHIADWDLDLDEQTCTRSPRHDRLFGYQQPLDDWNIECLFQHVHPEDVEQVRDSFEIAVLTKGEWNFECRVVWRDGSVHWIAGSGYHYTGQASSRRRMLGIVYDVSASRRAIIALREADRRKDEFLAMLAHELRNPLAPISSAADLLSAYAADASKVTQASAVISRQVHHMKRLIEDLLDVSRVTRGLVRLEKKACDMSEVVALAVEQARPFVEAHEHHISVQLPQERPVVLGDQARLVQVVVNLLNNAVKYTPDGGHIIVRLDVDERHIACSVIDNGIGMSAEFIERAFELFSQAETGLARTHGGLGLGLALVRSLVSMHDGTASARSEGIGLGAQFVITLPRARPNSVTDPRDAHGHSVPTEATPGAIAR